MNLVDTAEVLKALEIDLDLELCQGGQVFHLRGQGQDYELDFQSWKSFFQLMKHLIGRQLGWRGLWQVRTILKASGRRIGVIVKGNRRFSFGA